jgi:hypothetical protein
MAWNGDSSSFNFVVIATDRDLIERFADIIRADSPRALPAKRLKIVEKDIGKNLRYHELTFTYSYGFHEILSIDFLQSCFGGLFVIDKLLPFFTVRIEMVIRRSNLNEYSYNTTEDVIYVCSPAQYPKIVSKAEAAG